MVMIEELDDDCPLFEEEVDEDEFSNIEAFRKAKQDIEEKEAAIPKEMVFGFREINVQDNAVVLRPPSDANAPEKNYNSSEKGPALSYENRNPNVNIESPLSKLNLPRVNISENREMNFPGDEDVFETKGESSSCSSLSDESESVKTDSGDSDLGLNKENIIHVEDDLAKRKVHEQAEEKCHEVEKMILESKIEEAKEKNLKDNCVIPDAKESEDDGKNVKNTKEENLLESKADLSEKPVDGSSEYVEEATSENLKHEKKCVGSDVHEDIMEVISPKTSCRKNSFFCTLNKPKLGELPEETNIETKSTGKKKADCQCHHYEWKTFLKPTWCQICESLMVGVYKQGLQCSICNQAVHHECMKCT